MDNKVLIFAWYKSDGWYGGNHKAILKKTENTCFKNGKEAKEYAKKFKDVVNKDWANKYGFKCTASKMKVVNFDDLKTYKYNSFGPSYTCEHHTFTVENLNGYNLGY